MFDDSGFEKCVKACKIVEGQRYTKRLNEKQITALLKVTCQRPRDRENDILKTVQHNAYDQDPYAKEFGINISEKLASVEARILPAPWVNKIKNELFSNYDDTVMLLIFACYLYSLSITRMGKKGIAFRKWVNGI